MKKFVYLFFASLLPALLSAQIHEKPPKIITEIDSIANWINKHKTEPYKYLDYNGNDTVATYVWLIDNHISKVNKITTVRDFNNNTPILFSIVAEYYFSNNQPILIREDGSFDGIVNPQHIDDKSNKDNKTFNDYYYDHYEIMSEMVVKITDTDTIMVFNEVLKDAIDLLDKYKHLQNYNPYKNLPYDSIVAYDFKGDGGRLIIYKNKLDRSAKNPKKLTPQQLQKLIATVTDTATYGEGTSACFDPHLGFVFYHKGAIKSSINVCFSCNYLVADEYLPAHNHSNYIEAGDDYFIRIPKYGFSPQGIEKLLQLCKELGLTYCKAPAAPLEAIPSPNKE